MLKKLTKTTVRECLSFLDIVAHINSGKINNKATQLKSMYGISTKDATEIVIFWENNRKQMQIH